MAKEYFVNEGTLIGYLPTEFGTGTGVSLVEKKLIADGAITKGQLLTISGDLKVKTASAGDVVIGIAFLDTADGKPVAVHTEGLMKLTSAGAVTAGDIVVAADEGKIATQTVATPEPKVGIAINTVASAGEVFVKLAL